MLNVIYAVVGAVFMVGMALFALLRGGTAERVGAGVYLLAWFASFIFQQNSGMQGVPIGVALIDIVLLLVFVGLSWRYRQAWPAWASGLQLITVMGHIVILTRQPVPLASVYTVMNVVGYLIIITLIIGTFWAWQDRKAAGLE